MITSEELLVKFIKGEKNVSEEITFGERISAITQYCRYLKLMGNDPAEIEATIDSLLTEQGALLGTNLSFYRVFFKMHYTKLSDSELKEAFYEDMTEVWLPHKINLGYFYLNSILNSNKDIPKAEVSHIVDLLVGWIEERETDPEYEEFR